SDSASRASSASVNSFLGWSGSGMILPTGISAASLLLAIPCSRAGIPEPEYAPCMAWPGVRPAPMLSPTLAPAPRRISSSLLISGGLRARRGVLDLETDLDLVGEGPDRLGGRP